MYYASLIGIESFAIEKLAMFLAIKAVDSFFLEGGS